VDKHEQEVFGDFDWRKKWPSEDVSDYAKSFPGDLERALAALHQAFPPEKCRALFEADEMATIVHLFIPAVRHYTRPLLLVGRDLADVPDAPTRRDFARRLGERMKYADARFELGLLASLIRRGLSVQPEPETRRKLQRPKQPTVRCPDFVIEEGGQRIALEAKCLHSPQYEANRLALDEALGMVTMKLQRWEERPFLSMCLHLDQQGQALLDNTPTRLFNETVVEPLISGLNEQIRMLPVGTREIPSPPMGTLRLVPSVHNDQWELGFIEAEEKKPRSSSHRFVRSVVEGAAQVRGVEADLRVVAVLASPFRISAPEPPEDLNEALRAKSKSLDQLDAIVIVNAWMSSNGPTTQVRVLQLSPAGDAIRRDAGWVKAIGEYRYSY
jgi:hypothetical protein